MSALRSARAQIGNAITIGATVFAALAFATPQARADYFEQIGSIDNCFATTAYVRNPPGSLSASGHCPGVGNTGAAFSDVQSRTLGAFASSSTGHGGAEAEAFFSANLFFLPNQTVTLTSTMHFTGVITGGQGSGNLDNQFVFEAAVIDNGLNFGIVAVDGLTNVRTFANGQTGVGSFIHSIVTETDTSLARGNIDITLTETTTFNSGVNGITTNVGAFLYAQFVPAVVGAGGTSDFLDPGVFSFSVPTGTQFTFDGFLEATPPVTTEIAEPSGLALLVAGLLGFLAIGGTIGRRRSHLAIAR
jgi:hypothetical protein